MDFVLSKVVNNYVEICFFVHRFLIDSGANVSACNNEGELPIDLAEEDEMEELLKKEIDKQG